MLKTRNREQRLIETCISIEQPFVVDNTNPTCADRARYITRAQEAGFKVTGYYFQSSIEACKTRNAARPESALIPLKGLLGTHAKLELPSFDEGFDAFPLFSPDGKHIAFSSNRFNGGGYDTNVFVAEWVD